MKELDFTKPLEFISNGLPASYIGKVPPHPNGMERDFPYVIYSIERGLQRVTSEGLDMSVRLYNIRNTPPKPTLIYVNIHTTGRSARLSSLEDCKLTHQPHHLYVVEETWVEGVFQSARIAHVYPQG